MWFKCKNTWHYANDCPEKKLEKAKLTTHPTLPRSPPNVVIHVKRKVIILKIAHSRELDHQPLRLNMIDKR